MQIFIETERLILRELMPDDDQGLFEMESDKEVHTYLGNNPITTIEQARYYIGFIQQQYIDNGIGRWAVIEKATGNFIGWSGLKLMKELTNNHVEYYDLGYRFAKKYWGKGYATESAKAMLDYGFNQLAQSNIYALAHIGNSGSRNVLEKTGLRYIETFDWNGTDHDWFSISRQEWEQFRQADK